MAKQASQPILSAATRSDSGRSNTLRNMFGRDWAVALPFIAPLVVIMLGLIFWPFLNAVYMSFTVRNIRREEVFVGLANYMRLFSDTDYIVAVGNTVRFTVVSVVLKLIVGMTIALLLNSRLPFRNVLTGLMLLPWIVPEVVTAMAWRSIYDPIFGGLNPILQQLGLIDHPRGWLSEPQLAMPSVISVNIWKGIPFYTILLLAGLKAIDRELYEAAEVDGADAVARFRHITLPGLKYVILVTVLLSTISTFNTFGLVYLMTGGGPGGATRLYSILAYERAIIGLRFGPGAAVAFSMAPVLALVILLLARFMRHDAAVRTNDTGVDRALAWAGRWILPVLIAALLLYIAWAGSIAATLVRLLTWGVILIAIVALVRGVAFVMERGMAQLKRSQRASLSLVLRMLMLLPFLFFVLFPFYWIIITAFKT